MTNVLTFLDLSILGVLQYYKVAQLDERQKKGSAFLKKNYTMEAKFAELEGLFTHIPFYQAMVFLNHRGQAANLVTFLNKRGWPAMHITSGITQRERLEIMSKTRKFELRVLVCSDLVSFQFLYIFYSFLVIVVYRDFTDGLCNLLFFSRLPEALTLIELIWLLIWTCQKIQRHIFTGLEEQDAMARQG